jgi:hypothetical protein
MRKPLQGYKRTVHHLMRSATSGPYDEAGAARIMVRMTM